MDPGPHQNARGWLSCSTTIETPGGRKALEAEVMIALPNATNSSVVTCVEVRVFDLGAWTDAEGVPVTPALADLRLEPAEVAEFFVAAWHTAN